MQCFIVKDGVERKAELEVLFPVIEKDRRLFQEILRKAHAYNFDLPAALARLPNEMKENVYLNVSSRAGVILKKQVSKAEAEFEEKFIEKQKTKFIELIGDYTINRIEYPKHFIWKESPTPLETFIKRVEEACESGELDMVYETGEITREDIQTVFQKRLNDLPKIKHLNICGEDLPAAALLFEMGTIEELEINYECDGEWPPFLEQCQSLLALNLFMMEGLSELPSWIRGASSLQSLDIWHTGIESLPDWIGDLQSLTQLMLYGNENLKTLPDSIGNLKNLHDLGLNTIQKLPDSIGNLKNLVTLYLNDSPVKTLPDSIGNLKNLATLNLNYSSVEKLPDTIVNCTALESVDIVGTNISSVPDPISSVTKFTEDLTEDLIELIPQDESVSYQCFCNSYYKIVETIFRCHEKATREWLLSLEDDIELLAEGFFREGMEDVVNGEDADIIRAIMSTRLEREHDPYRKKLMEVAMEGILCIQAGSPTVEIASVLASLVNIKNNPLDAACDKYLSGDIEAFSTIDFKAAMLPEEEREEIRFIKRALKLHKIFRKEGLLALEKHLDREAVAARDVFDYGLSLVIDGWDGPVIDKIIGNLIERETDPVRKNLAEAKDAAVTAIYRNESQRILYKYFCACFDKSITHDKEILKLVDN
jgi:flagellar motor component MotA